MSLLQLLNVSVAQGELLLFEDVSLNIEMGQHIGLSGFNGSGKSTLLAVLAGQHAIKNGYRQLNHRCQLAVVEQFVPQKLAQSLGNIRVRVTLILKKLLSRAKE